LLNQRGLKQYTNNTKHIWFNFFKWYL
jgi:hypothetical protein